MFIELKQYSYRSGGLEFCPFVYSNDATGETLYEIKPFLDALKFGANITEQSLLPHNWVRPIESLDQKVVNTTHCSRTANFTDELGIQLLATTAKNRNFAISLKENLFPTIRKNAHLRMFERLRQIDNEAENLRTELNAAKEVIAKLKTEHADANDANKLKHFTVMEGLSNLLMGHNGICSVLDGLVSSLTN